jgi:hypothetical protein
MWDLHEVCSVDTDVEESSRRMYRINHPRHGVFTGYSVCMATPGARGGFLRIATPADEKVASRLLAVVREFLKSAGGRRIYGDDESSSRDSRSRTSAESVWLTGTSTPSSTPRRTR